MDVYRFGVCCSYMDAASPMEVLDAYQRETFAIVIVIGGFYGH